MARNTSQWAYQQQQQAPSQQPPDFSSGQPYDSYQQQSSMGGGGGYQGGYGGQNAQYGGGMHGGGGGGGAGRGPPLTGTSQYDPSEVLSDAIATVVFMPSKFERTTMHLAEKFNSTLEDETTMKGLVDSLVEQCLKEDQFLMLAGRFCSYLAQNVTVDADGCNLKDLLIER